MTAWGANPLQPTVGTAAMSAQYSASELRGRAPAVGWSYRARSFNTNFARAFIENILTCGVHRFRVLAEAEGNPSRA